MEIYLVRHTKPAIDKDVCYGQTDVSIDTNEFEATASNIIPQLPEKIDAVYSSPLTRCSYLANYIKQNKYQNKSIKHSDLLKEVHFGDWESKKWNDINQTSLQEWMNDFVNQSPPGGESFLALHERTIQFVNLLQDANYSLVIIVTHAGVIRSIISHVQQTLLKDAFSIICDYGSVTKLNLKFAQE
jgi:alpha-ribazole phosphatase